MKNKERNIPFGLKSITINSFRGIEKAVLKGLPSGTPWIFLTGRNGYGKSCLLQAIFIGLFGQVKDESTILEESDFKIGTTGYMANNIFNQQIDKDKWERKGPYLPVLGYGPSRLSIQAATSSNIEKEKSARSYSLFNPDGILLNIESELKNWFYRSGSKELEDREANKLRKKYQTVVEVLTKLMPNVADITVDIRENTVLYTESDSDNNPINGKKAFDQLASGSKSIVAMLGDMIIRLFRIQPKVLTPSNLEGIVIIDELDLHLHPDWQYELPGLLSEVFPKIQFIVSTHSPIPLLGAPEGSVFITVNRTKEEGITIKKLEADIRNLTPNLILTSEIFGFHNIIARSNTDQKEVRTEDTMEEKEFRDELKKRLIRFAEEEGDYPENLFRK